MMAYKVLSAMLGLIPWSVRKHIKRIPSVALLQRFALSFLLEGKEFNHRVSVGPATGITFRIRLPDDKGIWTGTYESDFAERLAKSVRSGSIAYDIGGWHGFFAGVMAAQCPRQVFVFEPLPANAERVRQLVALNPDRKIVLYECALGDRDTQMELIVMPETSMAKLEASMFQADLGSENRVLVSVRSIDSMIATGEIEPPDVMKIDVEGVEVLVLRGAQQTIRDYHPEIFVEVHSSELLAQCRTFLETEGYMIEFAEEARQVDRANDIYQIRAFA